jgi:hypothetical protein
MKSKIKITMRVKNALRGSHFSFNAFAVFACNGKSSDSTESCAQKERERENVSIQ